MKVGIKEGMLSAAIFIGVLLALVSVDDRVREHFEILWNGGNGMSSWTSHAASTGSALIDAARYQSIENAPLVVFAVVGSVLVLFMVKT